MTAPALADRSLPLAERVAAMIRMVADRDPVSDYDIDELLADIAAADRLARAGDDLRGHISRVLSSGLHLVHGFAVNVFDEALAAYRARMAQGVGDAE